MSKETNLKGLSAFVQEIAKKLNGNDPTTKAVEIAEVMKAEFMAEIAGLESVKIREETKLAGLKRERLSLLYPLEIPSDMKSYFSNLKEAKSKINATEKNINQLSEAIEEYKEILEQF